MERVLAAFNRSALFSIWQILQPRIGSGVYQDGDGFKPVEVGQVCESIIDPCSRLVSAVSVRLIGKEAGDQDQSASYRLVPMNSVEAVDAKHVWLKGGEDIEKYPPFEQKMFPLPAAN